MFSLELVKVKACTRATGLFKRPRKKKKKKKNKRFYFSLTFVRHEVCPRPARQPDTDGLRFTALPCEVSKTN